MNLLKTQETDFQSEINARAASFPTNEAIFVALPSVWGFDVALFVPVVVVGDMVMLGLMIKWNKWCCEACVTTD